MMHANGSLDPDRLRLLRKVQFPGGYRVGCLKGTAALVGRVMAAKL